MAKSEAMQVFRYRWSKTAKVDVMLALLIALFFAIGIDGLRSTGESRGFLSLAVALFLLAGFVVYRMTLSTIVISESGVGARVFGVRWRWIEWSAVNKIGRLRRVDGATAKDLLYYIHQTGGKLSVRAVSFDDDIADFRTLLDRINRIARRDQIPIVSFDRGADKERPLSPNPSSSRRISLDMVERRIDSL